MNTSSEHNNSGSAGDPLEDIKAPDWRKSTETEVEEALSKVWDKIDAHDPAGIEAPDRKWTYFAAAAVFLLAAGLGFLTMPVTYTATPGSDLTVQLSDQSEIRLAPGSSISHNRLFGITNRDVQFNGRAFFEVSKNDIPFIIDGSHTQTTVLGTAFDLEDWNDPDFREAALTVVEGRVRFASNTKGTQRIVKGNQAVRLDPSQRIKDHRYESRALTWMEGHLFFDDRTLHDVLDLLQRDFDVQIDHPEEHLPDARITAFYNQGMDLEAILDDICTIHGLNYYRSSKGYRIVNE